MFNPVASMFNPFKAAETFYGQYGNLGPKLVISGASWGPPGTFFMGFCPSNDRIGYEIQCSTHVDQCSTHLKQLEPLMANVAISGHKMAQKWPHRYNLIFWGIYLPNVARFLQLLTYRHRFRDICQKHFPNGRLQDFTELQHMCESLFG